MGLPCHIHVGKLLGIWGGAGGRLGPQWGTMPKSPPPKHPFSPRGLPDGPTNAHIHVGKLFFFPFRCPMPTQGHFKPVLSNSRLGENDATGKALLRPFLGHFLKVCFAGTTFHLRECLGFPCGKTSSTSKISNWNNSPRC